MWLGWVCCEALRVNLAGSIIEAISFVKEDLDNCLRHSTLLSGGRFGMVNPSEVQALCFVMLSLRNKRLRETMADDVPIIILLHKLQLIAEDRFLFAPLRKKVDKIVKKLEQILTFLEPENASSKTLMAQLPQILYSAEFITESFLLKTTHRRQKGVINKITKMPLSVFVQWNQIQLSCKMREIEKRIRAVSGKFKKMGNNVNPAPPALGNVRRHNNSSWHNYDETPDVLIGSGDIEKELVSRLINNEEDNLRVISLLSQESLGKTALAKKVYNRLDIRQHFQCRVWIHVPEDFTSKDLLLMIIAQIPINLVKDVELMNENQLSEMVFKIFMELKFLIVLDDVSTVDVWRKLVRAFADMANGSRVILTTRKADVALQVDPWSVPLGLKWLTDEDSWVLFLNKVKVGTPEENNGLRLEILRICRGLPPAIVLLGGVLSTMELSQRSSVIDHLSRLYGQDDHSVPLSNLLKSNFVVRRLADQYSGSTSESHTQKLCSTSESHTQKLCSYLSFEIQKRNTSNRDIERLLKQIMNRASVVLLKVFDIESIYRPVLPDKLGKLQNLTYVGLRWTGLYSCPASIGDLPCLETLDLKYTNITTLPSAVWKAKNLRHLYMNEVSIPNPSKEPSTNFQTLMGLQISSKPPNEYGFNRLTGLRKLRLTCHSKVGEETMNCISGLGKLRTLKLRSRDPFGQPLEILFGNKLKDHQSLLSLSLFGRIKDDIGKLPRNLKSLALSMSQLKEDEVQLLGKLPQLNILSLLAGSYAEQKMEYLMGNFRELRVLKMWKLENLEQWWVEEGGLPKLEKMEIRGCGKLKRFDGLKHLAAMKELVLTYMPPDFVADAGKKFGTNILLTNDWKAPSSLICK
ncbi:hypothetical protein Vadar_015245 [Vaccinium darrowii]|uniref:Uncharacterized protein n=1 Tax=Vaccinium darrowii TaxID=229202 RepID=A0ACB7XZ48_9ERIC|nr:hypothetical protein Vadar_015245 [Vaccinium darrowii]